MRLRVVVVVVCVRPWNHRLAVEALLVPVGAVLRAWLHQPAPASPLLAKPQKSVSHCPAPCLSERASSAGGTWAANPRLEEAHSICLCPVWVRSCAASTFLWRRTIPSLALRCCLRNTNCPRFPVRNSLPLFSFFSPPPKFPHTHIQAQLSASGGRQDVLNNPFPPVSPVQPSRFRPRT